MRSNLKNLSRSLNLSRGSNSLNSDNGNPKCNFTNDLNLLSLPDLKEFYT